MMSSASQAEPDFLGRIVKRRSVTGIRLTETFLQGRSRTPKHFHENAILGWVLDGAYCNAYNNGAHEVYGSRITFCPAGEPHTTTIESDAVTFALEFDSGWMERLADVPVPGRPVLFELGSMNPLARRIYTEFRKTDLPSAVAIEGLVLEIIATMMRFSAIPAGRTPRWLVEARDILAERFREHVTIREIADQVEVHPVYLASTFRHKYGCSILDFLHQLRIDYASLLLRESDDSLASIAHAAGFSDQSHLSRVFKQITGITPAEYKGLVRPS